MMAPRLQELGLAVVAVLIVSLPLAAAQQPPPNYSYDALPDTSFTCDGRVVGGYYADVEAGCQMFHVCGTSQRTSFRFLCPNNTVFDQQHLICANWFQVICDRSTVLYARNFEIFKKGAEQEIEFNALEEEDLPSLDDYDFDNELSTGVAGQSSGRSRPTSPAPVTAPPGRPAATPAPTPRAPRRFGLTSAATSSRQPSTARASFRDKTVFPTTSTAAVQSAPFSRRLLPTPLPPLSPTAAAAASTSSPRFQPSVQTPTPAAFAAPRVTPGEFRTKSPRPATFFTSARPDTPTTPRPTAAGIRTPITTPVPVFTTTGKFPFGFTRVPQTSIAFGNSDSFSFGTGVNNRAAPEAITTASSRAAAPTQSPNALDLSEVDGGVGEQASDSPGSSVPSGRTITADASADTRAPRPTAPSPTRTDAGSVPSRARSRPKSSPTTESTAAATASRHTVSPVTGRFFGANVLPEPAATEQATRQRGRGRTRLQSQANVDGIDPVELNGSSIGDNNDEVNGGTARGTTTLAGSRFSATVPTRSPSTRPSAGGGAATVTLRPRRPVPAGGRRRGSRRRPSTTSPTGSTSAGSQAIAVSRGTSAAGPATSRRPTVSRSGRRPAVTRINLPPTSAPSTNPPPAVFSNEIDVAPAPKPTRRPPSRGRGSRRFNPRLPGGHLSPVRYVRNRSGRGRTARPTTPPTTTPSPQRVISDIADVEALTDELNLLDEEQLLEELEREDRLFRDGPEANNRSINSASRRQQKPTLGTTPAPLRRGPAPSRIQPRRPTAAAITSAPQVIRKRIRVRGRPSRRPRVQAAAGSTDSRRPVTVTAAAAPRPAVTPAPRAEPSTLPTNKEASGLGRQSGGFFLRPKLQLSSALPTDLQTRRLNDVNALAAERTGRSHFTGPVVLQRAVRSTTRAPEARLSDILFASSSPGGAQHGNTDYDYQYYDSDFLHEHQDLIEEADDLFQRLSRKTRWT